MRKKMVSSAILLATAATSLSNIGCTDELGEPLRNAAIAAGATFVEATVLDFLNTLFESQTQP
jgi:hypothetical protein